MPDADPIPADPRTDELADPIPTGRARSLLNLAPPFRKGHSGNPSGKPKGTVQDALERKLTEAPRGGRTWTERIVDRWVRDAAKGNGYARQQILDRKYPVPKDLGGEGKVVLQALNLQLGGVTQQVFQAQHGGQQPALEGFAGEPESESHAGGHAEGLPAVPESEGSGTPETPASESP